MGLHTTSGELAEPYAAAPNRVSRHCDILLRPSALVLYAMIHDERQPVLLLDCQTGRRFAEQSCKTLVCNMPAGFQRADSTHGDTQCLTSSKLLWRDCSIDSGAATQPTPSAPPAAQTAGWPMPWRCVAALAAAPPGTPGCACPCDSRCSCRQASRSCSGRLRMFNEAVIV